MWNLDNRDIIVLISVISGCAILCNLLGPFYASTTIVLLVIIACCIYIITDDTPLKHHVFIVLDYLEQTSRKINVLIKHFFPYIHVSLTDVINTVKRLYRINILDKMTQQRRSTYQLSTETYPSNLNSSFGLVAQISPIPRATFRSASNSSNLENSLYADAGSRILERGNPMGKVSTPLIPWKKDAARNGDAFRSEHLSPDKSYPWGTMGATQETHNLSRGEDVTYSNEGSPWGNNTSPKMRSRAGGVKTVQTVAGPLLASTRYNIDPKLYSDITSPGLTSRLTKYATEANNKLTHQSQYGAGQFPRVNLNTSPTPLINTKTGRMRMPVTVRVAPPKIQKRYSPREKSKILSRDVCRVQDKTGPSVVEVLKDISLKRHASLESVSFEFAKKQRTDDLYSDGLENLEEMTQKRARDDSSRSEEEISPQNKSLRPAKRTKMPSCHDIISSLSSSITVSLGVKRKAMDISRSGTPDIGKHFKSLDSSHGDVAISPVSSQNVLETVKSNVESNEPSTLVKTKSLVTKIVVNASGDSREKSDRPIDDREVQIIVDKIAEQQALKLTDRLFMKAEPQNIDKLKTLIEEHGSIKPRFLSNETDEIKKSDIVNMRQTSMKSRLKSMFDAISGRAPSAINPQVVIQAEEPKTPSISSPITASLTSLTSTTNVNTSPIATSAIVPIIGKTKPSTTPAKHVTFQFGKESTVTTDNIDSPKVPIIETKITSILPEPIAPKKLEAPLVEKLPVTTSLNLPPKTMPATTFSFGSPSLKTSTAQNPTSVAITTVSMSVPSTSVATITTSPLQFTPAFSTATTSIFGNSVPSEPKTNPLVNFSNTESPKKNPEPAMNFSFGNSSTSAAVNTSSIFTPTSSSSQGFTTAVTTAAKTPVPNIFSMATPTTSAPAAFGGVATNNFTSAATPATTSVFSFGTNAPPQTTEKKPFSFGVVSASTGQTTNSITSAIISQPVSTPIVAATSAPTGFNFTAGNTAPKSSIFPSVTTSSAAPTSGFSSTSTPAFSFGSNTATPAKPGFSFGSNATTTPAATGPAAPAPAAFGATNNTAIPLFGASPATTTTATTSALPSLFGTPVASTSGFASTTAAPTFGATSVQPSFTGTVNTANTFGTPKTPETPAFGTPTFAPPSFAAATASANTFGATTNANTSTTCAPPAFGTSNFGETKPPPAFGANTAPFAGTSGTSLFSSQTPSTLGFGATNPVTTGATPVFGTPSTSVPTFGTPITAPPAFGATNTSTTSFGAPNNAAPSFGVISTTAPSFGVVSTVAPAFGAVSTAAPTFGAVSTAAPTFGAVSTAAPTFGAVSTAAPTFGAVSTAAPTFGAVSTAAPTFGAVSTVSPAFGVVSSTASPAFGLQSSVAGTTQNPASSAFSAYSPTFGAVTTAPPAFGTSISSSSGFGASATSGFGTPSNPPPAFSSTNTSFTGFGAGSNPPPFGTQPTAGTTSFGTPNSTTPSFGATGATTGAFTFGAAQPTQTQQPQQPGVFAFGSGNAASANNPTGAATPFQFSNTAAPTAGGFNFSGASSAPAINFSGAAPVLGANAFNAPTAGGMFSIGSGSTGPRSRSSRRKQR